MRINIFSTFQTRIFQNTGLMADMQQIVILAIRLGSRLFGRDTVFLRIAQKV